jgi:hypothetical protein
MQHNVPSEEIEGAYEPSNPFRLRAIRGNGDTNGFTGLYIVHKDIWLVIRIIIHEVVRTRIEGYIATIG